MDENVEAGKTIFGTEAEMVRQVKLPKCLNGAWPFYKHKWGPENLVFEEGFKIGTRKCERCNVVCILYAQEEGE